MRHTQRLPTLPLQSITILHGPINVLNEDAHVVHHQYPGAHWTQHPDLMRKHTKAYNGGLGSIFVGTPAARESM